MSASSIIAEITIPGEEIQQVLQDVAPYFTSIPREHAIIACLSIAAALQAPNASQEDLSAAVRGSSQWLCLFLEGKNGLSGADLSEQLN